MKKLTDIFMSVSLMIVGIRLLHTIGVLVINPTFYFEWGFYIVPLYVVSIIDRMFVKQKRYSYFQTVIITTFFILVLLKVLSVVTFSWWYVYLPFGIEIVATILVSVLNYIKRLY